MCVINGKDANMLINMLIKAIRATTCQSIPALITDRTGPYRAASSPLPTNGDTRLAKNLEFVSLLQFLTRGYVSKKKSIENNRVFLLKLFW